MRDVKFWEVKLAAADTIRLSLIQEIDHLSQWEKRGTNSWSGGGVFLCGRRFNSHDKAKLIRLQRKLKQLETTKIPFYQQRLGK